jgi:hypothetical protein
VEQGADTIVIQVSAVLADQLHPVGVLILMLAEPPLIGKSTSTWESEKAQSGTRHAPRP